jgi:ABC-type nitrate/sulfonate/bicarbonate transport system substrate-binding protein
MKMRMILFLIIFLLGLTFSANATAEEKIKVKVSLGYHIDPCQGPILLAKSLSIFEDNGIVVELLRAGGGEEASRSVALKKAHIGITKSANHEVRIKNGMPLCRIGALISEPLEVLITKDDIIDLKQLKGKRIGFCTSNPEYSMYVFTKIMDHIGLNSKDIELIAVHKGLMQNLFSGYFSAVFTATIPHDTIAAKKMKVAIKIYPYKVFGVGDYEQFMLFAHKDDEKKDYIRLFLRSIEQAKAMIKDNPHKAWENICKFFPELNNDFNKEVWQTLSNKF